MADRLRIGVIGTGRMGSVHARNLVRRMPEAEMIGLCDLRIDVAQAVAAELGVRRVETNYHELLDDDRVDAVLIAASTPAHAQIIVDAAAARKAIFCEKPLALDLDSIDWALGAVADSGVKLQVGFNRRFDASFRRVKEMVVQGVIGTPQLLKITNRDPEPPTTEYLASSGGMFLDMTIHDLDMARFLMGDVQEVYAMGAVLIDPAIGRIGDVDTDIVSLRFVSGALGVIDNSRQAVYGYDQRLEVFGNLGVAIAENASPDTVARSDSQGVHRSKPPRFFMDRYPETYVAEVREFIDCVLHDRAPSVSGRDGRLSVILGYAAGRSCRENRPIALSEIAPV